MNAEAPIAKDHPMKLAWDAYKTGEEYSNARKWALHEEHVDGSLWASFCAGWLSREGEIIQDFEAQDALMARIKELESRIANALL